jgi:hypothetical protein
MIKKSMVSLCVLFCMGCAIMHPPASFKKREVVESPREKVLKTLKTNARAEKPILEGSIGILPFKDRGEETGLGLAATEFLTSNLSMVETFSLIDMSYTHLLETELANFSPDKKQKALRAEQVVAGSVTVSGGALFVYGMYRTAEIEKYKEIAMMEGLEQDFFRLVADLGIVLLENNGITVTKEMADRFYTIPTEKLQAYILYAKGRHAEAMYDFDAAQTAYQQASEADPDFEEAGKSSERVKQKIMSMADMVVQTVADIKTEEIFTNPIEQPPSIEEQSVPSTQNTGTVNIDFELP